MNANTVPCHELRRAWAYFKAMAIAGPVVITTRGRPTHALMSLKEYQYLLDVQQSLEDLLTMVEARWGAPHSNSTSESARPLDPE